MKKHKKHNKGGLKEKLHHHKELKNNLTPEQKERRQKRMKKAMKLLMWMNPASAPVLAAMLLAQKEKERKEKAAAAGKPANPQVDAILAQMQTDLTNQGKKVQVALAGKIDVQPVVTTLDDLSAQAAAKPTVDVTDPAGTAAVASATATQSFAEGWTVEGLSYEQVFEDAKKKANALPDANSKKEALAAIDDAKKAVVEQATLAKQEVKNADPLDVSQAKAELAKTDVSAVAKSTDVVKVEKIEKPDAAEKKAIEMPPPAELAASAKSVAASLKGDDDDDDDETGGMPNWVWYTGGAVLVATAAYFIFRKKGQ